MVTRDDRTDYSDNNNNNICLVLICGNSHSTRVNSCLYMKKQRKKTYNTGPCFYCQSGREVDYKDVLHLKRFLTRRGKIKGRDQTGLCAAHQREAATAVKRAREASILPYVQR